MDKFDIKILQLLQENAQLSVAEISKAVGLSVTPCWRRINILEQNGVIDKRVTLLNREKVNLGLTVIVNIRTTRHDQEWFEEFSLLVKNIPEVIEFYRMSGETDYLLRVVVPSIQAYDEIYKKIFKIGGLSDVSSSFAMEEIKSTTTLPLNYC